MQYVSTRNKRWRCSASEAIAQGLAPDGGLLTPEVLPKLSPNGLTTMTDMSYQQRAVYVMNAYLDDFTASDLSSIASRAYGQDKFDEKDVAPVRRVDENTYCLELWHGPTCAFKDMALQMLPSSSVWRFLRMRDIVSLSIPFSRLSIFPTGRTRPVRLCSILSSSRARTCQARTISGTRRTVSSFLQSTICIVHTSIILRMRDFP